MIIVLILILIIGIPLIFINTVFVDKSIPKKEKEVVKYTETQIKLAFFSGMAAVQRNPEVGIASAYEQFKKDHFYKE